MSQLFVMSAKAWLKMLKNPIRNCRRLDPPSGKSLKTVRSWKVRLGRRMVAGG